MVQPRYHHNPNLLTRWTRMLAAPARAWSVFQQIFADHWEAFQHAHPRYQTPYYDALVAQDARLWEPQEDGLCRVSLPPLRSGQAPGGDELQIVAVLTVCQGLFTDNWVSQVSRVLHRGSSIGISS